MSQTQTKQVEVRRTFQATPQQVFAAWTTPEIVEQWWGPEGFTTTVTELDARVAGRFRIEMHTTTGSQSILSGIYRVSDSPHQLVFSMLDHCDCELAEDVPPQRDPSLVVVHFHLVAPQRTEVVIRHSGRHPSMARLIEQGWPSSLTKLVDILENRPPPYETSLHSSGRDAQHKRIDLYRRSDVIGRILTQSTAYIYSTKTIGEESPRLLSGERTRYPHGQH